MVVVVDVIRILTHLVDLVAFSIESEIIALALPLLDLHSLSLHVLLAHP